MSDDYTVRKMVLWLKRSAKCLGVNVILNAGFGPLLLVILSITSLDVSPDVVAAVMFCIIGLLMFLLAGFGILASVLAIIYAYKIPIYDENERAVMYILAIVLMVIHVLLLCAAIYILVSCTRG